MVSRSIARSERTQSNAGTLRLAVRLASIVVGLAVAAPAHLIFRTLTVPSPWPRLFLKAVARICGARVETRGQRVTSDVFFVSNHVSWLDIPVLAGLTGAAFVAQAPIADWPLIGWLCRLNRTVFVSRTDRMSIARQVETLRDALEHRQPIVVFPEGTTTDGQSLLPFKGSLFEVVSPPRRPMLVQPVLIDYGKLVPEYAWIDEEAVAANASRLLRRRGSFPVIVSFLEPIDPRVFADRKSITTESRKRIADALSASLQRDAIV